VAATRWIPGTGPQPGNAATAEPAVRIAASGKLNPLKKTTFYDLRVSEFTSALSLVRGETGTTFRRLKIEETESELCEQVAALG
jgi:hypothetical protein